MCAILADPSLKRVACIPAYDEENSIAGVILKTKIDVDEVIVVDDGSTDSTTKIAEALDWSMIVERIVAVYETIF